MKDKKPYNLESRSHKLAGASYKQNYDNDIICPECGQESVYRKEEINMITYTCLIRSCKYVWRKHKR